MDKGRRIVPSRLDLLVLWAIREQLRTTRVKLGLHQGELASMVGTTSNAVSAMERGVNCPNLLTMRRYATVLGIDFGRCVLRAETFAMQWDRRHANDTGMPPSGAMGTR